MSAVAEIRDWHLPAGDPYYGPALGRGEVDETSIRAALDAVAERGLGEALAIDAGAHIGTWSRPLAFAFGQVIAFEPHPALASLHRANMARAETRNVRLMEAALWNKCSVMGLKPGERNSGQAFVTGLHDTKSMTMVPTVALDAMRLPALDLLKLDVEGAELFALQGAIETIMRHRPVVVIEQNAASQRFHLPRDAAARWLEEFGMVETARVEFHDAEFNVIFSWPEVG